ncbi:MAG: acyltransferase [Methylovirgula sp.]
MSVDRLHAFAEGTTFPAPEHFGYLPADHPHQAAARQIWETFRTVAEIADTALLGPNAWPVNLIGDCAAIAIGEKSVVRGVLRAEQRGHIHIADHCYIGDDVILSAHVGIDIAPDVLIAHGCQIFDNVSHPLDAAERAAHFRAILAGQPFEAKIPAAPVVIEPSVWIGLNSIIMRGVRIGARSVVAAGSVVVDSVEPDTVVAGNPARIVKSAKGRSGSWATRLRGFFGA